MKKQSFIDLGCGNGLLVHILSAEGVGIICKICYENLSYDFDVIQWITSYDRNEPCHEKTSLQGFRPGHRSRIEA